MSTIMIVSKKGANLPVGECEMIKETADAYVVKAVSKAGRGRGAKTVLRQYVLPKSEVAYLYQEHEITAEEAAKYPLSNGVKAGARAVPVEKLAAAPAKRGPGRPKKEEVAVTAKKKPGRPKKEEVAAAPAKRGPGRPKKEEVAAAPAKRGPGRPKKEEVAVTAKKKPGRPKKEEVAAAPAKRGPGRPKKEEAAAPAGSNGESKRKPGRPKTVKPVETAAPTEVAAPPVDPPAKKGGSSLFTDFGS
jgi:hypothetical protein